MVLREAIPAGLARTGARKVAIGGISMGGFGALELAARQPLRFCAVGGHSPALWLRAADTAPGAFDDAADFRRNDLLSVAKRRACLRQPRVDRRRNRRSVPCGRRGTGTPVAATGRAGRLHVWPGGHDDAYWRRHMAQYLRFYADACG
jgi:Predicted esterase